MSLHSSSFHCVFWQKLDLPCMSVSGMSVVVEEFFGYQANQDNGRYFVLCCSRTMACLFRLQFCSGVFEWSTIETHEGDIAERWAFRAARAQGISVSALFLWVVSTPAIDRLICSNELTSRQGIIAIASRTGSGLYF